MKLKSDRKNYVIMALCAILLVMSIGYAAFSSLLTINGTASVSDSFCVGFDNTKLNTYVPTAGISGGTLPTGSMSYSGTACSTKYQPNSSLSATFKQPGDKIEYTLTIANKSTFTVAIESILVENQNVTSNTTITKGNIKYIVEMPLTTTLASNAETTMKVTAMFQNDTNVTGQYSGESQTLNVKINAEQGDSGFTPTPSTFTGTIYRWSETLVNNGDSIVPVSGTKWIIKENGEEASEEANGYAFNTHEQCTEILSLNGITEGIEYEGVTYTCEQKTGTFGGEIGEYTTDASTLNKTYYLKHDVVDDIITASYVCFVYNNEEYCMKGGDNGASFAANTQMIQDYQAFYNLPDNTMCNFNADSSRCNGTCTTDIAGPCGNFSDVYATSDGFVSVNDNVGDFKVPESGGCSIFNNGFSYCSES